jgi:hypothetical protein
MFEQLQWSIDAADIQYSFFIADLEIYHPPDKEFASNRTVLLRKDLRNPISFAIVKVLLSTKIVSIAGIIKLRQRHSFALLRKLEVTVCWFQYGFVHRFPVQDGVGFAVSESIVGNQWIAPKS